MQIARKPLIDSVKADDSTEPSYNWTNEDPISLFSAVDNKRANLLRKCGYWALFSYSLMCTDWVIARLGRYVDDDWPWLFRDACWAHVLSDRYGLPSELEDRDFFGPVKGPLCLSLTTVLNTRYGFDEDNCEVDACTAEQIAFHVLNGASTFDYWHREISGRICRLFPRDGSRRGLRIGPSFGELQINGERSLEAELQKLQLKGNPFVVEAM